MTTQERDALAIFGHAKPVIFGEFAWHLFMMSHQKVNVKDSLVILVKFCRNGWVKRMFQNSQFDGDMFLLTERGDTAFRMEQIRRGGDFRWFKYFDRSIESAQKWGSSGDRVHELDMMMKKLNPDRAADRKVLQILQKKKQQIDRLLDATGGKIPGF